MNAYEKRKAHRDLVNKTRSDDQRAVKVHEALMRCRSYENSYFQLYGVKCNVRYVNGWYWVHNRKYRASTLNSMIVRLEVLKHNQDCPAPEEIDDA